MSKNTIQEYNRSRTVHQYKYICHAPFSNLFFGYDGKIGVCCYNRLNIFGTYPDSSIEAAWNGPGMKDLRNKIKNYD
ncbi:MAG TPA: SPASM domain-containing protein, partial [Bacteroidales bacterium]|nr:SPASM domain-containing protein [Bacteroidales bacterium]